MRPFALLFAAVLALCLSLPARASAAEPPAPVIPALTGAPAQAALDDPAALQALQALPLPATVARPRPAATPLLVDLFDVLDRQDAAVAALQAELVRSTDPMTALALQRRIEKVKQDAEIELLHVQVAHARRAGRTALAARLDAAIAEMTQPPAPREPQERPAPVRDESR